MHAHYYKMMHPERGMTSFSAVRECKLAILNTSTGVLVLLYISLMPTVSRVQ